MKQLFPLSCMKPSACLPALGVIAAGIFLCACGKIFPDRFGSPPRIDSSLAMSFVKAQVKIGPCPAGSSGAERTAEWIRKTAASGKSVRTVIDSFTMPTPEGGKIFRNVIAEIPGKSDDFVLIGAHYDTKRLDFTPGFQGANDGASGVAALLAMIHAVSEKNTGTLPFTLRFVFLDGEECLYSYTSTDGLHGSRYDAGKLHAEKRLKQCRAMILLDMIGDRDLHVRFPADTDQHLLKLTMNAVRERKTDAFFSSGGENMIDDHLPYQNRGVPAILFIDFEYGPNNAWWHTDHDDLQQVSGDSIATVADTVCALIWKLAAEE